MTDTTDRTKGQPPAPPGSSDNTTLLLPVCVALGAVFGALLGEIPLGMGFGGVVGFALLAFAPERWRHYPRGRDGR